jgi:hypothetical protein
MLPAVARAMRSQNNSGSGSTSWAWPIAGLVLTVLGYKYVYQPWNETRKAKANMIKDHASTVAARRGKTLYDLNGKPVKSMNLGTIAADIHDSLEAWGPNDGKRVVRVFKTTPFGYVRQLEKLYLEKYGKNLKDHLVKELKDEDWISIKYWFK